MNSSQLVNTSILVEAKKEYTKHVSNLLSPIIMDGLQNIYLNSKDECDKTQDPEVLKNFQRILKQIPKWNQDVIDREYDRIMEQENCDILDDLIKAVFITNIKILSSVTNNRKPKNIQIEIPSSKRFIHKCYIESAREVYKDPFLFSHEATGMERHRNLKEIYHIVCDAVGESIRTLLPVKQILQEYLGESLAADEHEITAMLGGGNTSALSATENNGGNPNVMSVSGTGAIVQESQPAVVPQALVTPPQPVVAQPPPQIVTSAFANTDSIGDMPSRSPLPHRAPLFPQPGTMYPYSSPLMKMLNLQPAAQSVPDEELSKVQRAIKSLSPERTQSESLNMDIRPLTLSDSDDDDRDDRDKKHTSRTHRDSDSDDRSDDSSKSDDDNRIRSFRVDPSRRHQSVPAHKVDNVQDDIKSILLGQSRRDRTRNAYERAYGGNGNTSGSSPESKVMKPNRYRTKSVEFTIVKNVDKSDKADKDGRKSDKHRKRRESSSDSSRTRSSSSDYKRRDDKGKKNLFFEDAEEEDFDMD